MKLDPDEVCCVCHEVMSESENLTYCKSGCGRNIHIDCIEVWVKHKISCGQKITCPVIIINQSLFIVISFAGLIGAPMLSKSSKRRPNSTGSKRHRRLGSRRRRGLRMRGALSAIAVRGHSYMRLGYSVLYASM